MNIEFDNTKALERSNRQIAETTQQETAYQQSLIFNTDILKRTMAEITPILNKMGLEINSFSYYVNRDAEREGVHFYPMNVSFTAVSTGKFKFIQFAGYDAGGRGRNEKKLSDKAEMIASAINTKDVRFSVNQYSLQVEDRLDTQRVMFSGYLGYAEVTTITIKNFK